MTDEDAARIESAGIIAEAGRRYHYEFSHEEGEARALRDVVCAMLTVLTTEQRQAVLKEIK